MKAITVAQMNDYTANTLLLTYMTVYIFKGWEMYILNLRVTYLQ